jgi:hypothetical protein
VRVLAWFAVSAQVVFVAGWVLAGSLEAGYSPVRMYISELGRRGAAHPWIFDVSVVIWGIGFVALATAMLAASQTRRWALLTPLLFVLAGVFAVLDAPLRLDCAATIDHLCKARGAAGALSWRHYGHEWSSLGIEVTVALTPFALARTAWPSRLSSLALLGGVAIAILRAGSYLLHSDLSGYLGLEQRLWLLLVHGWVLLCAAALIFETSSRDASSGAPVGRWDAAARPANLVDRVSN